MQEGSVQTLLSEPMSVLAFLAALVGLIFWVSGIPRFEKIFRLTPPVIYVYFLPMIATTMGITPPSSPVYDWLTRYLLPFALLLLMVAVDVKAIAPAGEGGAHHGTRRDRRYRHRWADRLSDLRSLPARGRLDGVGGALR